MKAYVIFSVQTSRGYASVFTSHLRSLTSSKVQSSVVGSTLSLLHVIDFSSVIRNVDPFHFKGDMKIGCQFWTEALGSNTAETTRGPLLLHSLCNERTMMYLAENAVFFCKCTVSTTRHKTGSHVVHNTSEVRGLGLS